MLFSSLFREENMLMPCLGKAWGATRLSNGAMTLNKQRFAWGEPPEKKDGSRDDSALVKFWFSIPGTPFNRVDNLTALIGVNSILSPYEHKITRIDLALDDYEKMLTPEYIDEMDELKRFVGNPDMLPIGKANKPGWTRYIGHRRSTVYLRLYDKFFESDGLIDANRFEGEFKGRVAHEHYCNLQTMAFDSETIAAYIVEAVTGALRIVDGSNAEKYLCGVEPVWQEFLNHCQSKGGFRVAQPRRESSLAKTMQWLERSVKSSLATVKQALGSDRFYSWFHKLMTDGKGAMSIKHKQILKLLNRGDDTLPVVKPKLKPAKGFTVKANATRNTTVNSNQNKTVNVTVNATRNTTVNATQNSPTNAMMNRIMNATSSLSH